MGITSFKQIHKEIDAELFVRHLKAAARGAALVGVVSFLAGLLSGILF